MESPTDAFVTALSAGQIDDTIATALQADSVLNTTLKVAPDYTSERAYSDLYQLWGCLKGCDTLAATDQSPTPPNSDSRASPRAVTAHIDSLSSPSNSLEQQLNAKRNIARRAAVQEVAQTPAKQLYTLTLPTGAGKTLTGTQAALTARAHHSESTTGPLIYALPYTAIVDQTAEVFEDVFDDDQQLAVHHHLAPDDPDGTPSQRQLTALARDAWLSDVTLTTTVQLWETLIGPRKSQATKIPSLYNSTIILDEPQSLPITWIPAVESLLDTLINTYNATVILMSATQPIIHTDHQPVELGVDISLPSRVQYHRDESITGTSLEYDTAAARLLNAVRNQTGSTLAIANTIASAQQLHDAVADATEVTPITDLYHDCYNTRATSLDDALPDPQEVADAVIECGTVVTCPLTSRHRPCDRRRILAALKIALNADESPPLLAVTTQLIEAGVDISFGSVYRDIAPYDTLIQAAGRCNRNYDHGINGGNVTIWQLSRPPDQSSGPSPAASVYASSNTVNRLDITTTVLSSIASDSPEEHTILDSEQTYQQRLADRRPANSALSTALAECDGETLTDASLIESYGSVPTIVSRSRAEDTLINEYRTAIHTHNYATATDRLNTLRRLQVDLPTPASQSVESVGENIEEAIYIQHRKANRSDVITPTHGVQHPTSTVDARIL
jgi:CRISPR-associated endonuclease/helicase Cas3/CRISPR-associated endonuclease Cas3-HD